MNFEDGGNQENIIITQTKRSNIVYFPYMCVVAFNPSMWVASRYTVKMWKNPKKMNRIYRDKGQTIIGGLVDKEIHRLYFSEWFACVTCSSRALG